MKLRPLAWFGVGSALLCLWVFGDALWGRSLLAPLDIPPALFSKYGYVDPQGPSVPANHYIIDQITYDLPLQFTIYGAYHHGEIPWWDPYTYGGRPLLADAHINGTDPIRLALYALLPFELAYNWVKVLHFVVGGLGMFALLRRLKFAPWTCVLLALAWEFAGCHTLFFGHPWIQASFLYYPWLWLLWDAAMRPGTDSAQGRAPGASPALARPGSAPNAYASALTPDLTTVPPRWNWAAYTAIAGIVMAGVFYSGNLQSHAYVVLFAGTFLGGYGGRSRRAWWHALRVTALSGVIGVLLAAPVLSGQLELFLRGVRTVEPATRSLSWLSGLASLSAFFPWALGTFRTLDLGKLLSQSGLGFHLYIGSAGCLLAAWGAWASPEREHWRAPRRMALALVGCYLLILSTPLLGVFYTRCAGLAVLGLIVLAALGTERLRGLTAPCPRWAWAIIGATVAMLAATNLVAAVVYPRLEPRVLAMVARRDASNKTLDESPRLRRAQVERWTTEVSVLNPETWLAAAGLAGFGFLLLPGGRQRVRLALPALLVLNLAPEVHFGARFIPRHPTALWERLRQGGPEQQRVAALLGGTPQRLFEQAPGVHDELFPNSLAHLFHVRVVHGYAALQPKGLLHLAPAEQARDRAELADYFYESQTRGLAAGRLSTNSVLRTNGGVQLARFHWLGASSRTFEVKDVSLNAIEIKVGPGAPATLLRSDTWFPGWSCRAQGGPLPIEPQPPCFSKVQVPAGAQVLRFTYRPALLNVGLAFAGLGAALCATLGLASRRAVR